MPKQRPDVPEFRSEVWPILESRCLSCHGADLQRAGLRLDRGDMALAGTPLYFPPEVANRIFEADGTPVTGGLPIKKGTENDPITSGDLRDAKGNLKRSWTFCYDTGDTLYCL